MGELQRWVQETETGDYNEVPFTIPWDLWSEICCEKESCPEEMCSHFGACFYWQLRRRLAKAHLVITNQAMLLADARTDGNVLPSFHAAVIDEAHNLVDVATNAYSHELTRRGFMSYYRVGVQLQNALRDRVPEYIVQDLVTILDELVREAGQYFLQVEGLITSHTVPLTAENRRCFAQTTLPKHLKDIQSLLKECNLEEEGGEAFGLVEQFSAYTDRLLTALELILEGEDPTYAYWADLQNGETCLTAAPIEIGRLLHDTLFDKTPSVILTSATLSTNQSFSYMQNQLGLPEAAGLILGSPFSYEEQALLCVPKEAKNPNHPRYVLCGLPDPAHPGSHPRRCVSAFHQLQPNGRSGRCHLPQAGRGWLHPLRPGRWAPPHLDSGFSRKPRSLLFGTNSFWEGIDLPGQALKAVVITRLPFTVPDRPVTAARLKAIADAGATHFGI